MDEWTIGGWLERFESVLLRNCSVLKKVEPCMSLWMSKLYKLVGMECGKNFQSLFTVREPGYIHVSQTGSVRGVYTCLLSIHSLIYSLGAAAAAGT